MSKPKEKKLTPKQEKFCRIHFEGVSASEAYRQSYNCGKMKPETINRNAKALLDNNKIATMLQKLREKAEKGSFVTRDEHLDDLKDLRNKAVKKKQFGPAVRAETSRGKVCGHYTEKHEITGKDGESINLKQTKDMTKEELARAIADILNEGG